LRPFGQAQGKLWAAVFHSFAARVSEQLWNYLATLVAEGFATFGRIVEGTYENSGCPGSQAPSVLMNGGLQLGKDGLYLGRVLRGNRISAEFADAIIEATRGNTHRANSHGEDPACETKGTLYRDTTTPRDFSLPYIL